MIIDCFTFFNEFDLLEGRLEYLYNHVDYFVIVEADVSFTGKPKEFNYAKNINRYRKYQDKILYFPISIDVSGYDLTVKPIAIEDTPFWRIETIQRNHIAQALKLFDHEDICLIGDVDEIPSKRALFEIRTLLKVNAAVAIEEEMYAYNLNQKQFRPWAGTVATKVGIAIEQTPQTIRDKRWNQMHLLREAGWHLTYWGGAEQIQNKITNFAHQELINEETSSLQYIQSKISQGQDLFGRNLPYHKANPLNEPLDFLRAFGKYAGVTVESTNIAPYAETIEGWFGLDDMSFYTMAYGQLPNNSHAVEIGSWKGRSASHMAVMIANGQKKVQFDCVDTWEGSDVIGEKDDIDAVKNRVYNVFLNNMRPVEGYYTAKRMTSVEAAKTYSDRSLDLVFIDAAHDYDNVRADIIAWKDKVKQGGILSGHDYQFADVDRAVRELIGPVEVIGRCWYVRR